MPCGILARSDPVMLSESTRFLVPNQKGWVWGQSVERLEAHGERLGTQTRTKERQYSLPSSGGVSDRKWHADWHLSGRTRWDVISRNDVDGSVAVQTKVKHKEAFRSLAAQSTRHQALEEIGPHDHFCSIYESPGEHYAIAIPFIRIGPDVAKMHA